MHIKTEEKIDKYIEETKHKFFINRQEDTN